MARDGGSERNEALIEVADLARSAPPAVLYAALLAVDDATLIEMRDLLRRAPSPGALLHRASRRGEGREVAGRCV